MLAQLEGKDKLAHLPLTAPIIAAIRFLAIDGVNKASQSGRWWYIALCLPTSQSSDG